MILRDARADIDGLSAASLRGSGSRLGGYFAFYRERTRLRTAGKFVAFAVADFVVTNVVQLPLMWVIFLSALRF